MQAILVVFLVRDVGVGPGEVGAILAAASAGGVVGALVAPALSRRLGSARAILVAELGARRSACSFRCASSVLAALLLLTGPLRHRRDLPAAVEQVAVHHTSR